MKTVAFSDVYVDENSEWKLLAGLLDPKHTNVLHRLNEHMFTEERVSVYLAMRDTFTKYGVLDLRGLKLHLQGEVPGELLAQQVSNITTVYDDCIRLAVKREAKAKADELYELAKQFSPNDGDLMRTLTFNPIGAREDSSLTQGAVQFLGNLHAKVAKHYRFASTGMPWLDARMAGEWKPKSFVVIAAGPGAGKTSLVANSMLNMALQKDSQGNPDPTGSLFFSLEMPTTDLYTKWVADLLSIDSRKISTAKLSAEEVSSIEDTVVMLQQLPMYVIDNGKITLHEMIKEIREHVAQHNVRVVFVDYIQIVNHSPSGSKNSDLGEVSTLLKAIAKELDITVVVLSQMNRNGQGLDAIRDSGEIAQVADVVIMLTPEDTSSEVRSVEVDFLKNRYSLIGKTAVLFNGPYQRFTGSDR